MIRLILITFICFTSALCAQDEPLNIGVEGFDPPFVMQASNNAIYGFDIEMMNSLCKIMQRTCKYRMLRFNQLLDAVASKQVDVAISSISISPEREKIVAFSLPYLLSYSRFLERQSAPDEPFSLALLNNKRIGIIAGSVFKQQINDMGVRNATIVEYDNLEDELDVLDNGNLDFILLDNADALFWASNSSDDFKITGPAFLYGYGYGIAINASNLDLINSINTALVQYQSTDEYKQNYMKYISEF